MVNQFSLCMLLHALDFNDVNHKNHQKNWSNASFVQIKKNVYVQ